MLILVRLAIVLGHVGVLTVLTGLGGTTRIGLQSTSFPATEDQQSSGREDWAMGTVDGIVKGEKDNSQLLQIEKRSCHCVLSNS